MNIDEAEMKRDGKICSVCGDQALGHNFNAITCESCKAFFRRNALKEKELRCPFKESCQITSVTRRFCQRCRLDKCFTVGMKRELIMSEEDKKRKRKKKLSSFINQEQQVSSTESKRNVDAAVQTEFPPCVCSYSGMPLSDSHYEELSCTPLSSEDKVLLNDLMAATKALDDPVDQELENLYGDEFKNCGSPSLVDLIKLTSIAIRRLIKMCKCLWGFRDLPQSDQLSLLKQGCTQMMLLRSIVIYDPYKNMWKIPHSVDELSRIKVEVLKEAPGIFYEVYDTWLKSFDSRASCDIRIMCLLSAVALFEPSRTHLSSREVVKFMQERYYSVLQRYLRSLYLANEAQEIYSNLIERMFELRYLNEEHVRVYLNVDPSKVEPLLIEIFDLKTQ